MICEAKNMIHVLFVYLFRICFYLDHASFEDLQCIFYSLETDAKSIVVINISISPLLFNRTRRNLTEAFSSSQSFC